MIALLCIVRGHLWTVIPAQTTPTGTYGPYRVCARQCSTHKPLVLATEPPAGQPEALTPLNPTERVLLARYEAELAEEAKP